MGSYHRGSSTVVVVVHSVIFFDIRDNYMDNYFIPRLPFCMNAYVGNTVPVH